MKEPDGGIEVASLETLAAPGNLKAILAFFAGTCAGAGIAGSVRHDLRLAVEEVCSNVIRHGYPPGQPGPIRIEVREGPDRWEVAIEDQAAPFDPASVPAPDLTLDWEDRPLGGQGWHLVRNVVDEFHYARIPGPGNRVTLVKGKSKHRR